MALEDSGDGFNFESDDTGEEQGGDDGPEYRNQWEEMLRSTEPEIPPEQVGRHLDLEAEWWQHAGAGLFKMSNTRGTEAWMNLGMAVIILGIDMFSEPAEDEEEETPEGEEPEGPNEFRGPQ